MCHPTLALAQVDEFIQIFHAGASTLFSYLADFTQVFYFLDLWNILNAKQ